MPMTFDQYSNCSFGCLYCFASYRRSIGGGKEAYVEQQVRSIDSERVKAIWRGEAKSGLKQFHKYVQERKVMQWGGLSDPFCNFERKHGVGLEMLKFFKEIDYPLCFSTKGVWWLEDKRYTDLFRGQKNWNVKVSIITLDQRKARMIERAVPPPMDRIKALEKIANLDCGGATLRLRPFMIGITDPHHTELIRLAGEAGATAVSTEFFCFEMRSNLLKERLPLISAQAGFEYEPFYKKYSLGSGYLRLNRNIKRPYFNDMEAAAKKAGMRFYISDAHFKERCHNGSCCGLPEKFNYSRGQFTHALLLCKKNGKVTWDEISDKMEHLKGFLFRQAEGYNTGSAENRSKYANLSMYEYMRWLWNHPRMGQAPYAMFGGIMKPVEVDSNKNVVYEYDASKE
jgi:DNA repair photolyase